MKSTDRKFINLYKECRRIASSCFSSTTFPNSSDVHSLACALLASGLVKAPAKPAVSTAHAGVDDDQNESLNDSYDR